MDKRVGDVGLAEGWQPSGGNVLSRNKGNDADVSQAVGDSVEIRENTRNRADGRHLGERERGEAERSLLVAGSRARIMAENLTKSLGLSSSTDSEEDEAYEGKYKTEGSLALVADERQLVEVERSSDKVGGCERRSGRGLPIMGGLGSEEPLPLMADECQPAAVHESGGRADGGESESRGEVQAEADAVKGSSLERLMAEHGLLSASTSGAEKVRACSRVLHLTKSFGLGSSTDSEENEVLEGNGDSLAWVANDRRVVRNHVDDARLSVPMNCMTYRYLCGRGRPLLIREGLVAYYLYDFEFASTRHMAIHTTIVV